MPLFYKIKQSASTCIQAITHDSIIFVFVFMFSTDVLFDIPFNIPQHVFLLLLSTGGLRPKSGSLSCFDWVMAFWAVSPPFFFFS